MSHISKVEVAVEGEEEVVDLEALRAAVERLGGEWLEGRKTYQCYEPGWVGDTPPPRGWDPSMWGKCDHAARFPGCRYEVGILGREDGTYMVLFDYFGGDQLGSVLGGPGAPKLTEAYSELRTHNLKVAAAASHFRAKGWAVQVEKGPNQVQVLRATRYHGA